MTDTAESATNEAAQDDSHIIKVWDIAPKRPSMQFAEDGPVYELVAFDKLSIADRLEIDRLSAKRQRLYLKSLQAKLSKAQAAEHDALTDKLARLILPDLSDDEHAALSGFDKDTALQAFSGVSGMVLRNLETATEKAMGRSDDDAEPLI